MTPNMWAQFDKEIKVWEEKKKKESPFPKFPGSWMVRTFFFFFSVWKRNCRKLALSLLRAQVQSLVGELRSLYSLTSAFLRIHELRTFIESTQAHCLHCLSHGQHQRVDQSHPSNSVITDITQAFLVCQALGYQLCWIMIFSFLYNNKNSHFAGKETKREREVTLLWGIWLGLAWDSGRVINPRAHTVNPG